MYYLQTAYSLFIILLVFVVINCDHILFPSETPNEIGDNCTIIYDKYISSIGKCTFVSDCNLIKLYFKNDIYNHTVCGFIGFEQIVCCPDHEILHFAPVYPIKFTPMLQTVQPFETIPYDEPIVETTFIQSPRAYNLVDFNAGFDCIVNENFDRGVLKFANDCPEYNKDVLPQEVCDFDICKDLVCCPVTPTQRLKSKCRFVDDPIDEIRNRLHLNLPCSVENTKQKGRFQHVCDAPNQIINQTQYACNNRVCQGWYCCPITKPMDRFYCIRPDSLDLTTLNFVGPNCIDSKSGEPGTCRQPVDCPGFHSNLDKCGARCCVNFYCCPDVDLKSASVSQQMCAGYLSAAYKEIVPVELSTQSNVLEVCPGINLPVSGGSPSTPGEYPHMAALGYIPNGSIIFWNCGGSLISDKYILTAAHCLSPRSYGPVQIVRLGVILLNKFKLADDCPEDYNVSEIIQHPEYNTKMTYHDIGLIRLDREVKFNFHIRPICLPDSSEIPQQLYGMGWGLLGSFEKQSESLIQVLLEKYTHIECNQSYQFDVNRRFPYGLIEETQICFGSRGTAQSTCSGDSGGPLLNIHGLFPRMHTVYAITSFGKICGFADTPGVYTKVYPYIKWIETVVWNFVH